MINLRKKNEGTPVQESQERRDQVLHYWTLFPKGQVEFTDQDIIQLQRELIDTYLFSNRIQKDKTQSFPLDLNIKEPLNIDEMKDAGRPCAGD
jgi:hypothetical protein